jgi:outer membrane protein assembly factor BamB
MTFNKTTIIATILVLGMAIAVPQAAFALPFANGDVFVGVGSGMIRVFDQTGVLKQTLNTGGGSSETTGMCFDGTHMYATGFTASHATKFDFNGAVTTHPWAGPFNLHPESCVVDAAGDIYIGQADGTDDILKFDSAGTFLASFSPTTGPRGTDWIDLRSDQCTMRYTSEGTAIHQFDVCTNTQLPDFATGIGTTNCFGHRELPNGDHIVSCRTDSFRLDSAGVIQQTYPGASLTPPISFMFAMNLDPDGTSFWTSDIGSGDVYKIDIATGNQLVHFNTPPLVSSAGLAIFGEPTVSVCPPGTTGFPPECFPINGDIVAGEIIPIDSTALMIAGLQTSAIWMLPILAGAIGTGAFIIRSKLK